MSRLPYMSRILFWSIAKHIRIDSDTCCCFFNIRPAMVRKYSELVKRQARDRYRRFAFPSSRTAPLPRARRWEALAAATPLLLPHVCRRWEALVTVTPLLLPRARRRLYRTTRCRCGWSATSLLLFYAWWLLLLLRYIWMRFHPMIPSQIPRATMTNAPMSTRWAHITASIF
jgi:hypothetical protein